MQMQYRSVCIVFTLLTSLTSLAGCGDDRSESTLTPEDGPPLPGRWDTQFTVAGFTGHDGRAPTVYDFARDVDGSIVAAGQFEYLGGSRVAPLLRNRGNAWQPFRLNWELPLPPSGFSSVAIDPAGKLALATHHDFGVLEARHGEIWVDDGSGLRSIASYDGLVRRVRWHKGALWVAGAMRMKTRDPIVGVAVWDGTAWSPAPGGAANGFAFELHEEGDELYVGGEFSSIGGIQAGSIAAYNGTAWRALSIPQGAIYALERGPDGELYAGGSFGELFGRTGGLARWDGAAWTLVAGGLGNGFNIGVVTDITRHSGSLFLTGCFTSGGGTEEDPGAVRSHDVMRFDGAWHAMNADGPVSSPWFEPRACGDEGPGSVWDTSKQTMVSAGPLLYFGGSFPGLSGTMSQSIIAFDGSGFRPQGPQGRGLGGSFEQIAVDPTTGTMWGAGPMTHIAGARTEGRLARFTSAGWQVMEDELPLDAFCPALSVSIAGEVALGCLDSLPSGESVGRIFGVQGNRLVQRGPDLPILLTAKHGPDGTLWIGGALDTGGGFVGRLTGDTFEIIEDGFDAAVSRVEPIGAADLVVTGSFLQVDGLAAARIARWNGTSWGALGNGLPGDAFALAHHDGTIYVSTFDDNTGAGAYLLGAWDGASWKELAVPGSGLTPHHELNFNTIAVVDGLVIAGGAIRHDDKVGRGAMVYRDGKFAALGGGVQGINVSAFAVGNSDIWIAGPIAEAGDPASRVPSVGLARYLLRR